MNALREYWFIIVNSLCFLGIVIFYFVSVSGLSNDVSSKKKAIESSMRNINRDAGRKPTDEWFTKLEEAKTKLNGEIDVVHKELVGFDRSFDLYFSTEDGSDELVAEVPKQAAIYKELLAKKYDDLKKKYCQKKVEGSRSGGGSRPKQGGGRPADFFPGLEAGLPKGSGEEEPGKDPLEGKPFLCSEEVVGQLEPEWLRTDNLPSEKEIIESQKRYWLVSELFNVCEEQKVKAVLSMSFTSGEKPVADARYQLDGANFWVFRDIEFSVILPLADGKTVEMMKALFLNRYLFKVVGFSQKYIPQVPDKVSSNVPHIHFKKNGPEPSAEFGVSVRHFDILKSVSADPAAAAEANNGEGETGNGGVSQRGSSSRGNRGRGR